jgi:RNA polymerase sigma-70 factor (ECF subfamily)
MGEHAITLITDFQAGEDHAASSYDVLFAAHHSTVLRAAYRVTGNMQDAEDVLQTVFLRLLNRRENSIDNAKLESYLCRSAVNAGIDLIRSRQRAPTEMLIEEEHHSPFGSADSETRQRELRQRLRKALLTLDPHSAEVFALRFFEDYSNVEIAELMDSSPKTIAVTVHRARERLQHLIGQDW